MRREFLKLGIDHGTTNSAICSMESDGPQIIKVDGVEKTMPSAVYYDNRGRRFVGKTAYKAIYFNPSGEGEGYTGYKTRIGQDDKFAFRAAKKSHTAPELGGLVISELIKAYTAGKDEIPAGAVITVPAQFEDSACSGTREAAKNAGLQFCTLVQEPMAASLAYGFSSADQRAQWMVFDLGAGTLDVSIIYVRKGQMDVPEEGHAGDNRLGGREFDREIMEYVVNELRKKYALQHFSEKNPEYGQAWGRLMIACEQAKIQLSTKENATVELDGSMCKDEKGQDVEVEIPITREDYNEMIAPKIHKAVSICRNLLKGNRLNPKDLNQIILVGGPTKTPYIQECLADGLGVDVASSIDPMTAVATGAAIHAATVEVPKQYRTKSAESGDDEESSVQLQLEYERTPSIPNPFVAGRVSGDSENYDGFTVEISRADGWSSGTIPVSEDGMFDCDVSVIDEGSPKLSAFETRLMNETGKTVASTPEPQIYFPYKEVDARLANSLLIATQNNQTEQLVRKGSALPAKGSETFETTKMLRQGSGDDVLQIPVLEGVTNLFGEENTEADCNVHIGSLEIKGDDEKLKYDLPENSKLRITIQQNTSRELHCLAYVDLLDEEFEGVIKREGFDIEADTIKARFEDANIALDESESLQKKYPTQGVDEQLKTIRDLEVVNEISKDMERAEEGERDALYRAYRRTLELVGALKMLHESQARARIQQNVNRLREAVTDEERKDLMEIESEFKHAAQNDDEQKLPQIESSLSDLNNRVRLRPYYEVLLDLAAIGGMRVSNQQLEVANAGEKLIERIEKKGGAPCITAGDLEELKKMHQKFVKNYPDLYQKRKEFLDNNAGQVPTDSNQGPLSHVRKN